MLAGFTYTSELPFASFSERVLAQNVSHENDLIFMNVQVTYFHTNSFADSFCHRGKSKLGIRLFIHELLREPLIAVHNGMGKISRMRDKRGNSPHVQATVLR